MADLGVELNAVERTALVSNDRVRATGRFGECGEVVADAGDDVAVRHPDGGRARQMPDQRILTADFEGGSAVLPVRRGADFRPELFAGDLHAVADAEDRQAHVEDAGVRLGRGGCVGAGRAAGEDDAEDVIPGKFLRRNGGGEDERMDMVLAHPPGNQLNELGAKIEYGDAAIYHFANLRSVKLRVKGGYCRLLTAAI